MKHLYSGASQVLNGFQLSSNGLLEGSSGVQLNFPGQIQGGGSSVTWTGTNDGNQFVSGGIYTISVQTVDSFGNVRSWTQAVSVIPETTSEVLNIFNSAGELVDSINPQPYLPASTSSTSQVSLNSIGFPSGDKASFSVGGNTSNGVQFVVQTSNGGEATIPWNGRSSSGQIVAAGSYIVELVDTAQNGQIVMSKSFQLIAAPTGNFSVTEGPNPVQPSTKFIVFNINGMEVGDYPVVRLYNIAGELVGQASGQENAAQVVLNIGNWSSGIYIAVLEAHLGQSVSSRQVLNIALIR